MKKKRVKTGPLMIFLGIVLSFAVLFSMTIKDVVKDIKLGLDLQGGFEVLYEVSTLDNKQKVTPEVLNSTVESLRNRIDVIGVSEPNIQIEGENRVRVQLAGVKNQDEARKMLSTSARLSFRDLEGNLLLDGADLKEGGAKLSYSEMGEPWVSISLKDADKFADATEKTLGSQMVIWMDYEEGDSFEAEVVKENSKVISAPSVSQVLRTKDVQIQGTFSAEEAKTLANLLNSGSLPVDLKEVYSNSMSAKFGEEALQMTMFASIISVIFIFVFMVGLYRLPGLIAYFTLVVYVYLILLMFGWMGAVLTLPGIAAFVLGMGMALDMNIITYERIKEELRKGRSLQAGFKAGNEHSLSSIIDANLTTLLASGVMFFYGTSSVKGFAIMLILSIFASFVTSLFLSRYMLKLLIKTNLLKNKPKLFGVKESEINETPKP